MSKTMFSDSVWNNCCKKILSPLFELFAPQQRHDGAKHPHFAPAPPSSRLRKKGMLTCNNISTQRLLLENQRQESTTPNSERRGCGGENHIFQNIKLSEILQH